LQFKNWKRRWFVLRGCELSYFRKQPKESVGAAGIPPTPAGELDIRDFRLERAQIAKSAFGMRLVRSMCCSSIFT
jgi:hypothetical protein